MAKAKHGNAHHTKGKQGNRYAKRAHNDSFLHHIGERSETKGDPKNTAIETVKDVAVGVVGGGLVGAAIGKPSFLIGLGVTGVGHYTGNHLATLFGIGIMAANGFQNKSVSGVDGMDGLSMEAVKGRVLAYGENLKEKLYLDKVLPKKQEESASGIDGLQFFQHPNDMNSAYRELNNELSALDQIERQIEKSGMQHMQMTGMGDMEGYYDEMGEAGETGVGEIGEVGELGEMGELSDISDRNF